MIHDHHFSSQRAQEQGDVCKYCRRTPSVWQTISLNEKECGYCGTRVFSPQVLVSAITAASIATATQKALK
jgi:hypothetical protein